MDQNTLTYGQLAAKLQALGYTQHRSEANGQAAQIFEHPARKGPMILLPDAPTDQTVETPYMHKVLIVLRTHGLVEETNPLLT